MEKENRENRIMSYKQVKNMSMFDAYVEEEYIYFSNNTFNALMRIDKKSWKCKYLKSFGGNDLWSKSLHKKIEKYNNCLFFFPNYAKGISKYNLTTGELSFYKNQEDFLWIANIVILDKMACLVPKSLEQDFWLFDMETCCYINKKKWNQYIQNTTHSEHINLRNAVINQNSVWTFDHLTNILIKITPVIDECKVYYLRDSDKICSIASDGENLWIGLYQNQSLVKWNFEEGIVETHSLNWHNRNNKEVFFLFYLRERLFILPVEKDEVLVFDFQHNIRSIPIHQRKRVNDPIRKKLPLCNRCIIDNRNVYLLPNASDKMYVYNLDTNIITGKKIVFNELKIYYNNILQVECWGNNERYIKEMEQGLMNVRVDDLLCIVKEECNNDMAGVGHKIGCGNSIYNVIKNDC